MNTRNLAATLQANISILFIACMFLFGIAPAINGTTYSFDDFFALASNMDFNTVVSIVFSVTCLAVFGIWYYKDFGGTFKVDVKKNFHTARYTQKLIKYLPSIFSTVPEHFIFGSFPVSNFTYISP